jgi:pimeloyl-ACP methyl ester carboxylesterase
MAAALATDVAADVVVGFSMGAVVAYEMVVSGAFTGPVVLLAVSLSTPDEPASFRALIRLGSILGPLPFAALKKGIGSMVKRAPLPPERRAQLEADFDRNNTRDMGAPLQGYLRWLHRNDDPARRLCETGLPVWVLHAEKGDGGLTQHEREVLQACPRVRVVTLPGQVMFLPNETPEPIADLIIEALAAA